MPLCVYFQRGWWVHRSRIISQYLGPWSGLWERGGGALLKAWFLTALRRFGCVKTVFGHPTFAEKPQTAQFDRSPHLSLSCVAVYHTSFSFFCSLTRTPPNTPLHPTARTRAALRAPTPPTAVSWLWMVWNTPWMAESENQLTNTLYHTVSTILFHSVRTCNKSAQTQSVIFSSLPGRT